MRIECIYICTAEQNVGAFAWVAVLDRGVFALEKMHIVHCTSLCGPDASYAGKMHSRCTTTAGINVFDGGECKKREEKHTF